MLRSKKLQRKKETVVKTPTGLTLTMKCKKLQVSAAKKFDKHGGSYFSFSQMAFCYAYDTFYTAYAFGEPKSFERKVWFVCSKFLSSHSAMLVM